MKKLLCYLILPLLGLTLLIGCKDKDDPKPKEPTSAIYGSWKLEGFGNSADNMLRAPEPKDCEKCYTLSFKSDGTYVGHSSSNELVGDFRVNEKGKTLQFSTVGGTKIAEFADGNLFVENLREIETYSFSENESKLKLYFSDGEKYLLFKKQ